MKLLMVSSIFPYPPSTGGMDRIRALLRGLAARHEVTFASPIGRDAKARVARLAEETGARIEVVPETGRGVVTRVAALLGPEPYHVRMNRCEPMRGLVGRLLAEEEYDLIYVHFLRSMQYVPLQTSIPLVFDQHNADREMWAIRAQKDPHWYVRLLSRYNGWRMARYEDARLPAISAFVSVSEEDRDVSRSYAGHAVPQFFVAPNGVDTEYFAPMRRSERAARGEDRPTVAYLGAMDLRQNIDSVLFLYHEVLPRLVQRGHPVRLLVIGREPAAEIRALGGIDGIEVEVTGTVGDLRPYLARTDVMAATVVYGGGTKLKVLQAMASGLPVVATSNAARGIASADGTYLLVADRADALAARIASVIEDPELARRLGDSARRLITTSYAWDAIAETLSRNLDELLSDGTVGRRGMLAAAD